MTDSESEGELKDWEYNDGEDEDWEDEDWEDEDLEDEDDEEDWGASPEPYWFCECGYTDLDKAMPKDREKFYDSVSNGTALKLTKCPRCKSEGSFLPIGF